MFKEEEMYKSKEKPESGNNGEIKNIPEEEKKEDSESEIKH